MIREMKGMKNGTKNNRLSVLLTIFLLTAMLVLTGMASSMADEEVFEQDGSKIEGIDLFWLTPDSTVDNEGKAIPEAERTDGGSQRHDHLYLATKTDAELSMTYQFEVSFSGQYDYAPGDIQITIPAQVWHARDISDKAAGKIHPTKMIGTMELSVPAAPSTKGDFNWQLINGNYVLTNTKTIGATSKAMFQMSINGLVPHNIVDMSECDPITVHVDVVTNQGNVISRTSDPITAQIDTIAKITAAKKATNNELYEEVPDSLPAKLLNNLPEGTTADDYIYVRWYSYVYHTANQPFSLDIEDTIGDAFRQIKDENGNVTDEEFVTEGILLGFTNYDGQLPADEDAEHDMEANVLRNGYCTYNGSYDHTVYMWSAYKKDDFYIPTAKEGQVVYVMRNHADWILTEYDAENADPGYDKPTDVQKVTTAPCDAAVYYMPTRWSKPTGHFEVFKWTENRPNEDWNYGYGLNQLIDEEDVSMNFHLYTVGFGYPWTSVRTNPDDPEFVGEEDVKAEDFGNLGWRQITEDFDTFFDNNNTSLTERDFEMTYLRVTVPEKMRYQKAGYPRYGYYEVGGNIVYGRMASNQYGYFADSSLPTPDLQIEYQLNGDGEWHHAATAQWGSDGKGEFRFVDVAEGITTEGMKVYFPENTTDVRHIFVSNVFAGKSAEKCDIAAVRWSVYLGIDLKASDENIAIAENWFKLTDTPSTKFRNDVHMFVDGWIKANEDGTPGEGVRLYPDHPNAFFDTSRATISGASYGVSLSKEVEFDGRSMSNGGDNDVENRLAVLHYSAEVREQSNLTNREDYDRAVAEGVIPAETKGVWYDLLPEGVTPRMNTIQLRKDDVITAKYIIPDYMGTGRILLVVEANLTPAPVPNDDAGYVDKPSISFDAEYSWDAIDDFGIEAMNYIAFESKADNLRYDTLGTITGQRGNPDDPTAGNNYTTPFMPEDIARAMTNLDPNTDENRFVYGKVPVQMDLLTMAVSGITKSVQNDLVGVWTQGLKDQEQVTVYEGHNYTYRLRVSSSESTVTSDIVIYDTIENYHIPDPENDEYMDATKAEDYNDKEKKKNWQGDWEGVGQWRGTLESVDLSEFVQEGVAPVLYYSLIPDLTFADSTPGMSQDERLQLFSTGAYDLTDSNIWKKAQLDADGKWAVPADVYGRISAVALDARKTVDGKDYVLGEGDAVNGYLHMVAPDDNGDPDVWHAKGAYAHKTDADGNPVQEVDWDKALDPANNMYAFNNTRLKCVQTGTTGSGAGESSNIMIRNDYTRVGILPGIIGVKKEWKDQNNHDNIRPEDVTVTLLRKTIFQAGDYAEVLDEDGQPVTVTLSAENRWAAYFYQIDLVDEKGNLYAYTFKENEVPGYTLKITQKDDNHYILQNTHPNEKIELKGEKQWNDSDNALGLRPESITVKLYRDGQYVKKLTVTPDSNGNWTYNFGKTDKYEQGGRAYEYTVEEEYVPKYVASSEDYTLLVNDYSPYGNLSVQKTLKNATAKAAENDFTFTVTLFAEAAEGEEPVPLMDEYRYDKFRLDSDGETWSKIGEGTVTCSSTFILKGDEKIIIYDLPSETTYEIHEEEKAGFKLTDKVNDKGAILAGQQMEAEFTNTYSAVGNTQFNAHKSQTGHGLRKNQHQFLIIDKTESSATYGEVIRTAYSGTPTNTQEIPEGEVAGVITGEAIASFGQLDYTHKDDGKTFTYEVVEVNAQKPGYIYGTQTYTVTVTVQDNGDGTMTVTALDQNGNDVTLADGSGMSFENTYKAEGEITLKAWKVLEKRELQDKEFTFELYEYDQATGNTVGEPIATAQNDAEGNVVFPALHFDQDDVSLDDRNPAKYYYLVKEKVGTDETVVYTDQVYKYEITVYDNHDGTLSFTEGTQVGTREWLDCKDCDGKGYSDIITNMWSGAMPGGSLSDEITWVRPMMLMPARNVEDPSPVSNIGVEINGYCSQCGGTGYSDDAVCSLCKGCGYASDAMAYVINQRGEKEGPWTLLQVFTPDKITTESPGTGALMTETYDKAHGAERAIAVFTDVSRNNQFFAQASGNRLDKGYSNYMMDVMTIMKNQGMFDYISMLEDGYMDTMDELLTVLNVTSLKLCACANCDETGKIEGGFNVDGEASMPVFVNDLHDGQLTVTKQVQGSGSSDPDQEFTFMVRFTGEDLQNITTTLPERTTDPSPDSDSGSTPTPNKFYAKSSQLTGTPYAVLNTTTGELTFFRTSNNTDPDRYYFNMGSARRLESGNRIYFTVSEDSFPIRNDQSFGMTSSDDKALVKSIRMKGALRPRSMNGWFSGCVNLESVDLSMLDTSYVTNMLNLFLNCAKLKKIDLSTFDTSRVNYFASMFRNCTSLEYANLCSFTSNSITTLYSPTEGGTYRMFFGCTSLKEVYLSQFGKVVQGSDMFRNCSALEVLDLSSLQNTTDSVFSDNSLPNLKVYSRGSSTYFNYTPTTVVHNYWVDENGSKWVNGNVFKGYGPNGTLQIWHPSCTLKIDPNGGAGSDITYYLDCCECNGPITISPLLYRFGYQLTGLEYEGTTYDVVNGTVTIPEDTFTDGEQVKMTAVWAPLDEETAATGNVAVFKLKAGETATFENVPAGTGYEVWEETPAGWVLVSKTGDSGVIEPLETSKAVFTNEYRTGETQVTLRASKVLDGGTPEKEQFRFNLYETTNNTTKFIESILNKEGGAVEFTPIKYTQADAGKTFTYTINEVEMAPYWYYDKNVYTAEVKVTDNGSGKLSAAVTYKDANGNTLTNPPVFVNTTVPGGLRLVKSITVPGDVNRYDPALASQKFIFRVTLTDKLGQVWNGNDEGKVGAMRRDRNADGVSVETYTEYDVVDGVVQVPMDTWTSYVILYDIPVDTRYTVEEIGTYPGWTKQTEKNYGTTGVIDHYSSSTTIESCRNVATLYNGYTHKGTAVVEAVKILEGRTPGEDEFTFRLLDSTGAVIAEASNEAATGKVVFDELTFDKAGTYTYTICEVAGDDETVTYSDEKILVTVVMEDKEGEGRLTATVTYENNGEKDNNTITNTVKPGVLSISKTVVSSNEAHKEKEFTFTLYLSDAKGQLLNGEYAMSNGDALTVTNGSGTLTLKDGETVVINGLPDGAGYSVVEAAEEGFTQKSSGATGKIHANEKAAAEFTNTYRAEGEYIFDGVKTLEGKALTDGQFLFELYDSEGYVLESVTNDADGRFAFKVLEFTEEDVGEKTYAVLEKNTGAAGVTYDETRYEVTLTISDNGDGTLKVEAEGIPEDGLTFTNTYSNETQVTATKVWKGDEENTDARRDITISLYRKIGSGEKEQVDSKTIPADAEGEALTVKWDALPLFEEQDGKAVEIEYSVSETMAYGEDEKNPYVTSVMGSAKDGFTVINRYSSARVSLNAVKRLEGRVLAAEQFAFEITDENGEVVSRAVNAGDGSVVFPELVYNLGDMADAAKAADGTRTKEMHYTMSEVNDGADGYTYDDAQYAIIVTLTEDVDANLTAAYEMDAEEAIFTNIYEAEGSVQFEGKKELTGRTLENEQFSFVLSDKDGNVIETVKNAADGSISFTEIAYDETMLGEHTYTVAEVNDDKPGYTYSEAEFEITVVVTDNGDGTLEVTYTVNGEENGAITFENEYTAEGSVQFEGEKTLTGRDLEEGQFSFVLSDKDGNEIETVKNGADGAFSFTEIKYDETQLGEHKYTVTEVNDANPGYTYSEAEFEITVVVTDNGDGTLKVTYTVNGEENGAITFENEYAAEGRVQFEGEKTLTGRDLEEDQFSFTLSDEDGNEIETVKNGANGAFSFTEIKYDETQLGEHTDRKSVV